MGKTRLFISQMLAEVGCRHIGYYRLYHCNDENISRQIFQSNLVANYKRTPHKPYGFDLIKSVHKPKVGEWTVKDFWQVVCINSLRQLGEALNHNSPNDLANIFEA